MKLTAAQRRALERLRERADNPGTTLGYVRRGKGLFSPQAEWWLPQWTTLWGLRDKGFIATCPWDEKQFQITPAGRAVLEDA